MDRSKLIDGLHVTLRFVQANGITLNAATAGTGRPILLLHGWPFTWYLWHRILPDLVRAGFQVIAPDLRGIGGSSRAPEGYDLWTLAEDWNSLLDALQVKQADVVGFDLGLQSALMFALRHPSRVRRLVLTEALAGRLPGAEEFLKEGPPWWFGFHGVPGLAEDLLVGREETYLNWFYENSTVRKLSQESREEYVRAYIGRDALRGGFLHYRAFMEASQQLEEFFETSRLQQPTLFLGGGTVKDAGYRQLVPVAENIRYEQIDDCGHVTPQEQPKAFLAELLAFLSE